MLSQAILTLIKLIAPVAPHLTEEMWHELGGQGSVHSSEWPTAIDKLTEVYNRNYLIDSSLEVIEKELNPNLFFRISRKFIIPLDSVKEIQMHSNSRLKIILPTYKEDEVIVAREKVSDFKTWIG